MLASFTATVARQCFACRWFAWARRAPGTSAPSEPRQRQHPRSLLRIAYFSRNQRCHGRLVRQRRTKSSAQHPRTCGPGERRCGRVLWKVRFGLRESPSKNLEHTRVAKARRLHAYVCRRSPVQRVASRSLLVPTGVCGPESPPDRGRPITGRRRPRRSHRGGAFSGSCRRHFGAVARCGWTHTPEL
jgi:hypothetical protein